LVEGNKNLPQPYMGEASGRIEKGSLNPRSHPFHVFSVGFEEKPIAVQNGDGAKTNTLTVEGVKAQTPVRIRLDILESNLGSICPAVAS